MNPFEIATKPVETKKTPYQVVSPPVKASSSDSSTGVLGFLKDIFKGGDETAGGILRNTVLGLPKATSDFAKTFVRAPGRAAVSASSLLANNPDAEITPATKTEKFLFGDEPIKSISRRNREAQATLEGLGLSPSASKVIAPIGVAGLTALDLYPGTSGRSTLVKELAAETSEVAIKALLKKSVKNISDDVIEELAPQIAKTKTATEVEKVLTGVLGTPVEKLTESVKVAKNLRPEIEAAQTAERARRFGVASGVQEQVGGEQGYYAALSRLKGSLIEKPPTFESPRANLSNDEIQDLFTTVQTSPVLNFGQQLSTQDGLLRLLRGEVPQPAQLSLLEEVFGSDLIKAIRDKRPLSQKIWENIRDAINIPRSIITSMDASAVLRQGSPLLGTYPRVAGADALKQLPKVAFSEKAFNEYLDSVYKSPEYKDMFQSGLYIADPRKIAAGLNAREEAFMSNLVERIPILGEIPKASSRAYSGFLNKLRIDTFNYEAKILKETGRATPENLKALADFVNTASGRGSLGKLGRIAPELNALLFSPRFNASRLQMMSNLINPNTYTKLTPSVRKATILTMLTFTAELLTLAGIAKMGGLDVETDPRSSDFLKIKFPAEGGAEGALKSGVPAFFGAGASTYDDETRLDFAAGFQPWIRLFATLITGETKSTRTGRVNELDTEKFGGRSRLDVIEDFLRTKFAPIPGTIANLLEGQDIVGEPATVTTELRRSFIPLYLNDVKDAYGEWSGFSFGEEDTAVNENGLPSLPELPTLPPLPELSSLPTI